MADWIEKVAKATGKSPQTIRLAIQGGWEIGTAMKLADSRRYEYIPHPKKIKELIGIDIGENDDKDHNSTCAGNCDHCITHAAEREKA